MADGLRAAFMLLVGIIVGIIGNAIVRIADDLHAIARHIGAIQ